MIGFFIVEFASMRGRGGLLGVFFQTHKSIADQSDFKE